MISFFILHQKKERPHKQQQGQGVPHLCCLALLCFCMGFACFLFFDSCLLHLCCCILFLFFLWCCIILFFPLFMVAFFVFWQLVFACVFLFGEGCLFWILCFTLLLYFFCLCLVCFIFLYLESAPPPHSKYPSRGSDDHVPLTGERELTAPTSLGSECSRKPAAWNHEILKPNFASI